MNRLLMAFAALLAAAFPALVDSAFKGIALLALAGVLVLLMRRASAAARHLIWMCGIIGLLLLPVLSAALPSWRVLPKWAAIPFAARDLQSLALREDATLRVSVPAAERTPAPDAETPAGTARAPLHTSDSPVAAAGLADTPTLDSRAWLVAIWSAVATVLLLRLGLCRAALPFMTRRAEPLTRGQMVDALHAAAGELGLRCRVRLYLDRQRLAPLVWGVVRPCLLLPGEAAGWDSARLRAVLLHELAHVKRGDLVVLLLTQIACAIHWWNPLAWLAARRLHVERERACDDLVLSAGVRASEYAEHLMHVATALDTHAPAGALAMARPSRLEGRLLAVLNATLNRNALTRRLTAAALLLGALLTIPLAMLHAAEKRALPPGIPQTFRGIDLTALPMETEFERLPELWQADPAAPGMWKSANGVFDMPVLGEEGAWFKALPAREVFYLELRAANGKDVYFGPIAGDPFEKLGLLEFMRRELRDGGRYSSVIQGRVQQMIKHGAPKLRLAAFELIKLLREPQTLREYEELRAAVLAARAQLGTSADASLAEAAIAHLDAQTAARDRRRISLSDDSYSPGERDTADSAIVWGEPKDGLRVGYAPAFWRTHWFYGDEFEMDLWVACVGSAPVKFSSTPRMDDGLSLTMTDAAGHEHQAKIVMVSIPLLPSRYRLQPGERVKLKSPRFSLRAPRKDGEKRDLLGFGNGTFELSPGKYRFAMELRLPGFERSNPGAEVSVPAAGEWIGELRTAPVAVQVVGREVTDADLQRDVKVTTAPPPAANWTNKAGQWEMANGVQLEVQQHVVHATDRTTTAVLHWPPRDGHRALRHEVSVAQDVFAAREPWALAWEDDAPVLWIAKGKLRSFNAPDKNQKPTATDIHRVDFSDPARIIQANGPTVPDIAPMPGAVRAALQNAIEIPDRLLEKDNRVPAKTKAKYVQRMAAKAAGEPAPAAPSTAVESTTEVGAWQLGEGLTLVIEFHARYGRANAQRVAIIRWPAKDPWPALRHEVTVAGLREKFAMAWEKNGRTLWIADQNSVRAIHFADPAAIREDTNGRNNNTSFSEIPAAVRAELAKHFTLGRQPEPDGTVSIGGNVGGQQIKSAQTDERWVVEGRVTNAAGEPMSGVTVQANTEYKPLEKIAFTRTDEEGRYFLAFRTDLETLARFRGLKVTLELDRGVERELQNAGEFTLLLRPGEEVKSFAPKQLVLGEGGVADFTVVNASTIEGQIVDAAGQPLAKRFIAAKTVGQRAGYSIASVSSDEQGRFKLDGIPPHLPVLLQINPFEKPSETCSTEPRHFDGAKAHRVRLVVADPGGGRETVKLEEIGGEAASPAAKKTMHEQTAEVMSLWRAEYGGGEVVPAEAIARLEQQVRDFIARYPGAENDAARKLAALLSRVAGVRVWRWGAAEALLNEICDIATAPVGWLALHEQFRAFNRVKPGQPWTAEQLSALPFGPAAENGLRAAWIFDPMSDRYAVGSVLKCRIIFHNSGKAPVEFFTDQWHQDDTWHVSDAEGRKLETKKTWFSGLTPFQRYRLDPGQVVEVAGHGVGIGAGKFDEQYSTGAIGIEVHAKAGDEVHCAWDVQWKPADVGQNAAPQRLRTGTVKFRVVAADPQTPQPPGVARGTGRYDLAPGAKLQVTQVTSGKDGEPTRRANTATIVWQDSAGKEVRRWPIELPPGIAIAPIVWERNATVLWVAQPDTVRKINFSDPTAVTDESYPWDDPWNFGAAPAPVRAELEKARPRPASTPPPQAADQQKSWEVHVVDGLSGKTLPNAKIAIAAWKVGEPVSSGQERSTSDEGMLDVTLPTEGGAVLTITDPRFFGANLEGLKHTGPEHEFRNGAMVYTKSWEAADPKRPLVLKCWPGTRVTGQLVRPDGTPAAGAALNIGVYISHQEWKKRLGMDLGRQSWDHGTWPNWSTSVVTDEEGRFAATVPPAEARGWVRVGTTTLGFHPLRGEPGTPAAEFAPLEQDFPAELESDGNLDAGRLQLEHGVVLRGRVEDADGNPLSGIILHTSGKHGPYAGRQTLSAEDGSFAFPPHHPSTVTVTADARLRDGKGAVISRDVRAVFAPLEVTLPRSSEPVEITVRAEPHVTVEFEWIDRRQPPDERVSYYGGFPVTGRLPRAGSEPVWWRGETEKTTRDGRTLLFIKVPANLVNPTLALASDSVVHATYQQDDGPILGPGTIDLGNFRARARRVIFANPPTAAKSARLPPASSKRQSRRFQ